MIGPYPPMRWPFVRLYVPIGAPTTIGPMIGPCSPMRCVNGRARTHERLANCENAQKLNEHVVSWTIPTSVSWRHWRRQTFDLCVCGETKKRQKKQNKKRISKNYF